MDSAGKMERYDNLGELLHAIRTNLDKTQSQITEMLNIKDVRIYRRWESGNNIVNYANLKKMAKILLIPLEVVIRLNYDYPTLYNIKTKRYSLCPFDTDYMSTKIIQEELMKTNELGNIKPLISDKIFKEEKKIHFPIYPYDKTMDGELLYAAALKMPELNVIITDPKGLYSGHMVVMPLHMDSYYKIRNGTIEECELAEMDLVDSFEPDNPIVMHILSLFATNSTYVYCLVKRLILYLISAVPKKISDKSLITRYAITDDGAEFGRKFPMEVVRHDFDAYNKYKQLDYPPHVFEISISKIEWLSNYRRQVTKI